MGGIARWRAVCIGLAMCSSAGGLLADTTTTTVTESVPTLGHRFGHSVAFSGNQLLIGVPGANEVQVWDASSGAWMAIDALKPSLANVAGFGRALAADATRVVVGATPLDGSVNLDGRVFVFERSGSTFVETAVLSQANSTGAGGFGLSVALDSNTLVVHGYKSLHVFVNTGSTWSPEAVLSGNGTLGLGAKLALDGDVVAAGRDFVEPGIVDVFVRNAGAWTHEKQLTAGAEMHFGRTVSLDGDVLAVGSEGQTRRYERAGGAWTLAETFGPANVEHLILRGDGVLAAEHYSTAQAGVTSLWAKQAGTWLQQTGTTSGNAIAWEGNRFAVGRVWPSGPNWISDDSGAVLIAEYTGASTGSACTQPSDCTSGWCVGGTCCDESCGAKCSVCSASAGATVDGACTSAPGPACCISSADCGPAPQACTKYWCEENVCTAKPDANCCSADEQCDDQRTCTEDRCVNSVCENTPLPVCPGASGGTAGSAGASSGSSGGCGCRTTGRTTRTDSLWLLAALALGRARRRARALRNKY